MEVQPAQLTQQRRQLPLAVQIQSVAGDILGDDNDLLDAGIRQLFGLRQHVLHAAAAVAAPQGGDHTEGAAVVAALGNAQKGVVPGCGQHPLQLLHRFIDAVKIPGRFAVGQRAERLHDTAVAAGAHDAVHLRQFLRQLLLIALGQAAGHQDLTHKALFFQVCHRQNGVDGLLLGAVNKAAGVDDHHVRAGLFVLQGDTRITAQGHHLLGIHQILGAAQ